MPYMLNTDWIISDSLSVHNIGKLILITSRPLDIRMASISIILCKGKPHSIRTLKANSRKPRPTITVPPEVHVHTKYKYPEILDYFTFYAEPS